MEGGGGDYLRSHRESEATGTHEHTLLSHGTLSPIAIAASPLLSSLKGAAAVPLDQSERSRDSRIECICINSWYGYATRQPGNNVPVVDMKFFYTSATIDTSLHLYRVSLLHPPHTPWALPSLHLRPQRHPMTGTFGAGRHGASKQHQPPTLAIPHPNAARHNTAWRPGALGGFFNLSSP